MKYFPLGFVALFIVSLSLVGCGKNTSTEPSAQPQQQEPSPTNSQTLLSRVPTLCWWPFANSESGGFHEAGANLTPEQMCDAVRDIGGMHDIPPKAQWPYIESRGQKIDCTMWEPSGSLEKEAPFMPSIGDEDDARRAEILKQMMAWMDLTEEKGIPKMLCFFGEKSGDDAAAQWRRTDESLLILTAHAEKLGIQLCFEPLNSIDFGDIPLAGMKGHVGMFSSDPLEFLAHLKKIGKPKVCGMALDFYHPAAQYRAEWTVDGDVNKSRELMTRKLIELYDLCSDYVLHIHTAGCFLDDERMRAELHLDGYLIDYRTLMTHVWNDGYTGNWLIEYISTNGATKGSILHRQIIVSDLHKAVELCKPLGK